MECSCHTFGHASGSESIDNTEMTSSSSGTNQSIIDDCDTPTTSTSSDTPSSSLSASVRLKRIGNTKPRDSETVTVSCKNQSIVRSSARLNPNLSLFLLLLLYLAGTATGLKCYCTEDHCLPFGACEGPVCMVGILRENNQVIRTCGARAPGCHR